MTNRFVAGASALLAILLTAIAPHSSGATDDGALTESMRALLAARPEQPRQLAPMHATPCVGGFAGSYPCSNVDLLAFVPVGEFGASSTNSLWGWTDPQSGIEYALIGANNGIAFYDLGTPDHPRYLGKLPTHTGSSVWRDVRVYANHAFVVSDANNAHGLQVFDLTRLRGVTSAQTFTENAWNGQFTKGHTIAINEATGYAYVAGSNTCGTTNSLGGLRMYDIHDPLTPTFAGCVTTGGYTHESQCWVYAGPDTAHVGKEICVNANGPAKQIALVDVTNKAAPVTLSSTTYTGAAYPHQGWLTDDHRYLLVNDELDEQNVGHSAWTWVWDVSDLDAPVLVGHHDHGISVIDHNLYTHGNYVYASNYEAGLRILRMDNLSQAAMTEVAYFDVLPGSNAAEFNGSWNNYRFPGSGHVIATSIDEGFFVLQPNLCTEQAAPTALEASANGANRIDLLWGGSAASYRIERAQGGCGGSFETIADNIEGNGYADTDASGLVGYGYRVVANAGAGVCASNASACVAAQTTGACTAPPYFDGIGSATSSGTSTCGVQLNWPAATAACGGALQYSVHRASASGFMPSAENRIASAIGGGSFLDSAAIGGSAQYYVVRASDAGNGSEEHNLVERSAIAAGPVGDGTFTSGAEPGEPLFDSGSADGNTAPSIDDVRHAGWHLSTARKHAGGQSFWSTAANNLCVTLITPPIALTAGESPELSFWSVWDTEAGYDGGVVEISTNDGSTWSRLTPIGGYPATITNGGSLCGIAQGSGAFSGPSQFNWTQSRINLAAYAGSNVLLRWNYRTDGGVVGTGWFVDDVAISHAQVPSMCLTSGDLMFRDGFDTSR